MGSRELLITEMVLECVLADKQPSEIAALLSCLVFQQKTRTFQQGKRAEPQLTKKLKQVTSIIVQDLPLPHLPPDACLSTLFVIEATLSTLDVWSLCKK
jgi:superfamily II RNA helicase